MSCQGVPGRGRRILQRLAPYFEPSHGYSVFRAIEKSAAVGIAESLDRKAHRALGRFKITRLERRLPCIEKCSGGEDLIVERAIERRAADAM